jgi:uncharacterized protein with GYD domain
MAAYIIMTHFTEQGARNIKDSPKRAEVAIALGKKMGVKVKEIFWTIGPYDTLMVAEAANDETIAAFAMSVASRGSVKTLTMRAFRAKEVAGILGKMA